MSEFFQEFLQGVGPVSREFTYNGVTKTVHVRKPTAAQALQLARGQTIAVSNAGNKAKVGEQTMNLELGDVKQKQQMKVHFCICDAEGKDRFRSLAQVQALPDDLVDALATLVDEETQSAAGK